MVVGAAGRTVPPTTLELVAGWGCATPNCQQKLSVVRFCPPPFPPPKVLFISLDMILFIRHLDSSIQNSLNSNSEIEVITLLPSYLPTIRIVPIHIIDLRRISYTFATVGIRRTYTVVLSS